MDPAITLAIVWHSRTGAAQQMAKAAFDATAGRAVLLAAAETQPAKLLGCGGYLFICPENLGSMSGVMKDMFDRSYYPLLGAVAGRPYATAIAAGSDGRGAEAQIDRIVTGWRLRRVSESLIVNLGAQTPEQIVAAKQVPVHDLMRCAQLAQAMTEGLEAGIF